MYWTEKRGRRHTFPYDLSKDMEIENNHAAARVTKSSLFSFKMLVSMRLDSHFQSCVSTELITYEIRLLLK